MSQDAQKLILVIDDEEAIVLLLETILSVYGYRSIACMNPEKAIQTVLEQRPNLIILDIAMPGIDGYEICSKLKSNPETANIPILMLTALALAQDKKHSLECGADAFVFKPFDPQNIIEEIEKLIN
jgi:CheY-like chemotaxis protein